mmetsp:Transcript_14427/g.40978  ORF Transcript_14427/g.40978 Transcript_14427/m.40978 type:complete len:216 (+) Transcript_14427:220-867(+)
MRVLPASHSRVGKAGKRSEGHRQDCLLGFGAESQPHPAPIAGRNPRHAHNPALQTQEEAAQTGKPCREGRRRLQDGTQGQGHEAIRGGPDDELQRAHHIRRNRSEQGHRQGEQIRAPAGDPVHQQAAHGADDQVPFHGTAPPNADCGGSSHDEQQEAHAAVRNFFGFRQRFLAIAGGVPITGGWIGNDPFRGCHRWRSCCNHPIRRKRIQSKEDP